MKQKEHNRELIKKKRSPSPTTTTNGRGLALDHNKIINLHQNRISQLTRGRTSSRTKTLAEGGLTKEINRRIIGPELVHNK